MSNTAQVEILDTIQGRNLPAVQAAVAIFARHNLDLEQYRITVMREGNSLIVTFTDKDGQAGGRGAPGTRPGFEVELNARTLQVLRSNFIR